MSKLDDETKTETLSSVKVTPTLKKRIADYLAGLPEPREKRGGGSGGPKGESELIRAAVEYFLDCQEGRVRELAPEDMDHAVLLSQVANRDRLLFDAYIRLAHSILADEECAQLARRALPGLADGLYEMLERRGVLPRKNQ
jgi:hypothetical protein